MKDSLKLFNEMLVDTAVHQIAVEDLEEDNPVMLADLEIEAGRAKIDLVEYILSEGPMLRLMLIADQAARVNQPGPRLTGISEEERHRLLTSMS